MKKIFSIFISLIFLTSVSASSSADMVITSNSYEVKSNEEVTLTIKNNNDLTITKDDYIIIDFDYFDFIKFEGIEGVSYSDNKLTFNSDMTITSNTIIGTLTLKSNEVETTKDVLFNYDFYHNDEKIYSNEFNIIISSEKYTPVVEEETTFIEEKKSILPYVLGGSITIGALAILFIVIKKFIK